MLTVSEAQFIIITAESMVAGRNDTGEVAESYILTCTLGGRERGRGEEGERHTLGLAQAFNLKAPPPSSKATPLNLSNPFKWFYSFLGD